MINASLLNDIFTAAAPMPGVDPLGYGIPPLLFQLLSYLTFSMHITAMNFTVGGAILFLWLHLRRNDATLPIRRYLGGGLPLGMSYVVTLGIPPLLFVQVLYGQQFYSSSILIGSFWILIIPLLITAYGLFYLHKLTRDSRRSGHGAIIFIGLVAMLLIGFFYVNNITLSMTPEKWLDMYAAKPDGLSLNPSEPTLFPRFLLFITPAIAVSGLGIILAGSFLSRWGREAEASLFRSFGVRAVPVGFVLQAVCALWIIAVLPENISAFVFAGNSATVLLVAGIILAALAAILALIAAGSKRVLPALLSLIMAFAAIFCHAALRDMVRLQYLAPVFDLSQVPVKTQWGMFGIFVATLLLGLALLIVLMLRVFPGMASAARK